MGEEIRRELVVEVHYIAAKKPFITEAPRSETVAELTKQSLHAFGLKETPQKQYRLFYEGRELNNPNETLGEIAGDKKALKFQLEEILVQGTGNVTTAV